MNIRLETTDDADAIRALTTEAFRDAPHSSGMEAAIVDGLRDAGALTLSLVAEDAGVILGHVAFSPVSISVGTAGWYGLGPVSVLPARQGQGIGSMLIRHGLELLKADGVKGCVLLGDPAYYARFGFRSDERLRYADVPPEYFQYLVFGGPQPVGAVSYHPAFDVQPEA